MGCGCSKNVQQESQEASQAQQNAEAQRANLAEIRQNREAANREAKNKAQAWANAAAK
jgi:hypothetical protein